MSETELRFNGQGNFSMELVYCIFVYMEYLIPGRGVLYIFWVRGRAIGRGIDFHDLGIKNGIDFRNLCNWYRVRYALSENWYKVGYIFLKNW